MWYNEYIGLPFKEFGRDRKGLDCWGLYRLVFRDLLGIDLPSYDKDYIDTKDFKSLGRLIPEEANKNWKEIWKKKNKIPLSLVEVEVGDAIIMRMMNVPMHVGFITKQGWMLHIMEGIDATHEQYTGLSWRDRVVAIYRYTG